MLNKYSVCMPDAYEGLKAYNFALKWLRIAIGNCNTGQDVTDFKFVRDSARIVKFVRKYDG